MSDQVHLPGLERPRLAPEDILGEALERHAPVAIYGLVSGGNDSAAVLHWLANTDRLTAAVHMDTTIGVPETREWVEWYCRNLGVPLIVKRAEEYEHLVRKFGFPGPGLHRLPYVWLKDRSVEAVVRETKTTRKDRVMFVSGARRQESERRMGTALPTARRKAQVWANPFFDYSKGDLGRYRQANDVPENPVALMLGKSGECFCGAFAKPGELEDTEALGYPAVVREIRRLEREMRRVGHPACVWGARPQARVADRQRTAGQLELPSAFQPMCVGCGPDPQERAA